MSGVARLCPEQSCAVVKGVRNNMSSKELKKLIELVRENLKQGRYRGEQAVREAIVLPILQRLGWDTIDPTVVRQEYSIGKGRVDYCLCAHPANPDVIIEVKAVGLIEGGDVQLFRYAFDAGVPMLLLTDGQVWNFYLAAGAGSFNERRVYKLDLLERTVAESDWALVRYLAFERVKQKQATTDAQSDLNKAVWERAAADTLSAAWSKLVAGPELIDLLLEKTMALCGHEPAREQVETFLAKLTPAAVHTTKIDLPPRPPRVVDDGQPGRGVQIRLNGQLQDAKDAITGLIQIIKHLSSKDPTFLERLEVRTRGRARNHLARSPAEVYPLRPELAYKAKEILPGWFLDTNISNREKLQIVERACEVAGLRS